MDMGTHPVQERWKPSSLERFPASLHRHAVAVTTGMSAGSISSYSIPLGLMAINPSWRLKMLRLPPVPEVSCAVSNFFPKRTISVSLLATAYIPPPTGKIRLMIAVSYTLRGEGVNGYLQFPDAFLSLFVSCYALMFCWMAVLSVPVMIFTQQCCMAPGYLWIACNAKTHLSAADKDCSNSCAEHVLGFCNQASCSRFK